MTAPDYIRAIFDPSDRLAVVVQDERRGETLERITTALRIVSESFQDWLRYKNECDGCDIYLGMNPLKPQALRRTKDDIQVFKHLFIDFDRTGGRSLQVIERSNVVPPPSYVLNTSPGRFQLIWRMEGVTVEHGEALLHSLARHFDADPARNNLSTVLRLPGYANRKYKEDFLVALHAYTERTYHPRDFRFRIEPADSSLVRRDSSSPSAHSEPSQSERDGAYAKHALARGFPPEEVIRDIAEFRAHDTPHAQDYARRTVIKAQAELSPDVGSAARGSSRKPT
jgi:hypothetical protein